MSGPAQSGLLVFAKDLDRVAHFYETIMGLSRLKTPEELVVLQGQGIQLLVHSIPAPIAAEIHISSPPERRENTALKFFFTVPSICAAKAEAAGLGGEIFSEAWDGPGFRACDARDPEGNVFQIRERAT